MAKYGTVWQSMAQYPSHRVRREGDGSRLESHVRLGCRWFWRTASWVVRAVSLTRNPLLEDSVLDPRGATPLAFKLLHHARPPELEGLVWENAIVNVV